MNKSIIFPTFLLIFVVAMIYLLFFSPQIGMFAERKTAVNLLDISQDENFLKETNEFVEETPTEVPEEAVEGVQVYQSPQPTTPKLYDCGSGHLVPDLSMCGQNQPQKTSQKQNNTYKQKKYYTCTICYPNSMGCYTYNNSFETKAACDAEQASVNRTYQGSTTNVANPTVALSDEEKQQFIDQVNNDVAEHNRQVEECRNGVNNSYATKVQNCYNQFGGNSAAEACVSIANSEKQSAFSTCGSTI